MEKPEAHSVVLTTVVNSLMLKGVGVGGGEARLFSCSMSITRNPNVALL